MPGKKGSADVTDYRYDDKRKNNPPAGMASYEPVVEKRVAQENELLCKILAYNITVLIHEMFESGVTPDFLTLKSDA